VECLAGYGRQEVPKCGWKGKKSQLLRHVNADHGLEMIYTLHPIEDSVMCVGDADFMQVLLVCTLGELFWLTRKHDVRNNKRLEVLHYIGSAGKAAEFRYRCDLISTDKSAMISFLSKTRSTQEDKHAVFGSNPYFQMDFDIFVRYFVENNGHVPGYKLSIKNCHNQSKE
jgi:hypothetical protein